MSLVSLFLTFLYVGAFTIGGGLVAITFMQQEIVGRGLLSPDDFFSMVAISESTPGPIGINMATYIGYRMHGPVGGLVTTIGTVIPSLVCIIIIARYFGRIQEKPAVKAAFYTLRAGTTGMVAVAAWQVLTVTIFRLGDFSAAGGLQSLGDGSFLPLFSWPALALFAGAFALSRKLDWHPVFFVLIGAVYGVLFL